MWRNFGYLEVAFQSLMYKYSQTCIKRSPLGHRKSDLIRQVTSKKRLHVYIHMNCSMTGQEKGDLLIQVTA